MSLYLPESKPDMKGRLLWISDGVDMPSGFATVARNVTFRLADMGWEIYFIHCQKAGLQMPYYGAQFEDMYITNPNAMVWQLPGSGEKAFGASTFEHHYDQLIKAGRIPDAVVMQMDLHMGTYLSNYHRKHGFRWVHYLPVDGEPIPPTWDSYLQNIDKIITFSKYGQNLLQEQGYKTPMIYHGVNTEIFKPHPPRQIEGWENKFIIGCINRNQHRKRIPEVLKAYSLFRKGKESKVFLYLHMYDRDMMGWDIPNLMRQMGISGGVGWATDFDPNVGYSMQRLVNLYNNLDVSLSCTAGEGFGLTTVEAMACEVPVVITDYTTSDEIVGFSEKNPAGLPIRVRDMYRPPDQLSGVQRGIADPQHAAEQLEVLYEDEALRKELGKNGRERCKKLFNWDKIAKQWDKVLGENL